MAKFAFVYGILLGGCTLLAILLSGQAKSMTMYIPTIEGVLLIICGAVALNPKLRMHAMHAAASVGLLGALLGGYALLRLINKATTGGEVTAAQWTSVSGMVLLSILFVVACVQSFIAARRARESANN
ncbi:MAG: hypothetical protein KDB03_15810 [Planctomycetales bacterium]|nr:hypothetical protein [Planctomycetales bacterium]